MPKDYIISIVQSKSSDINDSHPNVTDFLVSRGSVLNVERHKSRKEKPSLEKL